MYRFRYFVEGWQIVLIARVKEVSYFQAEHERGYPRLRFHVEGEERTVSRGRVVDAFHAARREADGPPPGPPADGGRAEAEAERLSLMRTARAEVTYP